MARRRRSRPAARQVQHWLPGLAGLVLLGLAGLVVPAARAGEITGTGGPLSLGTVVNGQLAGSCRAGLCTIGGGTGAGRNLFHRFSALDTRGAIGGVLFQTQGHRNLVEGVMNPLGTVVDKAIQFSGPANLFWLSPGGITLGSGASFGNVQTLTLSTATGLRLGGGVFDVFGTTAAQAAALNGDPLPGRAGLLTDPASLAAGGLAANGDVTLSGGLLTLALNGGIANFKGAATLAGTISGSSIAKPDAVEIVASNPRLQDVTFASDLSLQGPLTLIGMASP